MASTVHEPQRRGKRRAEGSAGSIAARVADQAAGGQILITEPVRRAVRDVPGIELGGAREVDLKGVRDSPDLYPVLMPVDA